VGNCRLYTWIWQFLLLQIKAVITHNNNDVISHLYDSSLHAQNRKKKKETSTKGWLCREKSGCAVKIKYSILLN
jgi:hypothetical protein